jgi:hypothetical protein
MSGPRLTSGTTPGTGSEQRVMAVGDVCAYCGKPSLDLEPDHVPPRTMFAPPRPHNLVTVPSCAKCHRRTSKNDEYFRLVLSMREDVFDHPDIKSGVLDSALRSLARPQARGHARSFLQTIHQVNMRTTAGLHLGHRGAYIADGQRVCDEVERIVRGLYFHHKKQSLGTAYIVRVFEESFIDWSLITEEAKELLRRTAQELAAGDQDRIGRAFQYARGFDSRDDHVSAWLLRFYDRVVFLAVTAPL